MWQPIPRGTLANSGGADAQDQCGRQGGDASGPDPELDGPGTVPRHGLLDALPFGVACLSFGLLAPPPGGELLDGVATQGGSAALFGAVRDAAGARVPVDGGDRAPDERGSLGPGQVVAVVVRPGARSQAWSGVWPVNICTLGWPTR